MKALYIDCCIRGKESRSARLAEVFLENLSPNGESLCACFDTGAPGHTNLLRPENYVRQMLLYQLEQLMQEKESGEYCNEFCALSYLVQVLVLAVLVQAQALLTILQLLQL